jgi:hypothetical protein
MTEAIIEPPPAHLEESQAPAEGEAENGSEEATGGLWRGSLGWAVMIFGIWLPSLLIASYAIACFERVVRLLFKHPIETLVECVAVIAVPVANFLAWRAFCNGDKGHGMRLCLLNGMALGTGILAAAFSAIGFFDDHPLALGAMSSVAACSAATSLTLCLKLRQLAETRLSRTRRLLYAGCGLLLSVGMLGAAEARSFVIRLSESMALSTNIADREVGMQHLRQLDCEQDLRMQCADERTAGLCGLLFKISPQRERRLYFELTGKPYGNSFTDSVYSMSDEYLQRNVVGDAVKELSLVRSAITGDVNNRSLTCTTDWTMVLKNDGFVNREARAEIALPPGAVVSDLTLWSNGQPYRAGFGELHGSYGWTGSSVNQPAVVTDLGRGRVLLQCSSVPAQGEQKVRLAITTRLKPESQTQATLVLPQVVAANFSPCKEHRLRLRSADEMSMALAGVRRVDAPDGTKLLEGSLKDDNVHGAPQMVRVTRNAEVGPFVARDDFSPEGGYIVETLNRTEITAPDNLVVVLDGSQSMRNNFEMVRNALLALPKNVKASLLVAGKGDNLEAQPLDEGLKKLDAKQFTGGYDNLEAVIKAAELAGDTKHGAVLWIHGPQPSFNEEIYITTPYISRPRFYEMALDNGFTDVNEFLRNHQEIGPFVAVPRCLSLGEDLTAFVNRWAPGSVDYVLTFNHVHNNPDRALLPAREAAAISKLYVRDACQQMLQAHQTAQAAQAASGARIVTTVSSAAVTQQTQPEPAAAIAAMDNNSGFVSMREGAVSESGGASNTAASAPPLQGAASGTIGPQGTDATVISGVNTAGTVRVNNLANLEATLNIFANGGEILGLLIGFYFLVVGFAGMASRTREFTPFKMSGARTAFIGCALMTAGLAVPGVINWFVCSARDANLFS